VRCIAFVDPNVVSRKRGRAARIDGLDRHFIIHSSASRCSHTNRHELPEDSRERSAAASGGLSLAIAAQQQHRRRFSRFCLSASQFHKLLEERGRGRLRFSFGCCFFFFFFFFRSPPIRAWFRTRVSSFSSRSLAPA
jgi:hypothetical protein